MTDTRNYWESTELKELIGKTLVSVEKTKYDGGDSLVFHTLEGKKYRMFHSQNCCENVYIESITGELSDLVDSPIRIAEESSNRSDTEWGSNTWTFYKLASRKGYVDVRWFGESNGYYSESVDFMEEKDC
jgi:hypothetical protein